MIENPLGKITDVSGLNTENVSVIGNSDLSVFQIDQNLNKKFNAALNQRIQYIEISLEMQYCFIKNKLDVNVIGGFSSFILSDNQVV